MIIEYVRPERIEDALVYICRPEPKTYPMGGGTVLNRPSRKRYAVCDLQALGLSQIERRGNHLVLGATTPLQRVEQAASLPAGMDEAIRLEGTANLRQVATTAGTLVSADGRSSFAGALLALDAKLDFASLAGGKQTVSVGELLALREKQLVGKLILSVTIPLNVDLCFEAIARTPRDLPVVYAMLARWPTGRIRLVLGGTGKAPTLVVDGPQEDGLVSAACAAYSQAGDRWASAAYRQEMAGILTTRCLEQVTRQ